MDPTRLPFRSSYDLMPSGLPLAATIIGPYHQAGPEKLITLSRAGVWWMLPAMTSVRLDSSAGICDSHGIHSILTVFSSSHASGGACENPRVMPFFWALASDGSPQLSNIGLASLKKVGSWAIAGNPIPQTKPRARARRCVRFKADPPFLESRIGFAIGTMLPACPSLCASPLRPARSPGADLVRRPDRADGSGRRRSTGSVADGMRQPGSCAGRVG